MSSLCTSCRRLRPLRHAMRRRRRSPFAIARCAAALSTGPASPAASSAQQILSKPSWSIGSLLAAASSSSSSMPPLEPITPAQLHHLLRLSALPLPGSAAEEQSMIATLQSQLRFARVVKQVDTARAEPLRAIRDETEAGVAELTVGLDDLKDMLAKETLVGHYQRPRRVREVIRSDAEDWQALATASRKAGKYFVVESGKKAEAGEP